MAQRGFQQSGNPGFSCAESVILLPFGRRSYLPAIIDALGGVEIQLDETTDRQLFILEQAPTPTSLVYSGMGAPAAANALEMVTSNGARQVVVLGACGGLRADVAAGDLIAVTAAVRGEGTSAYYAPPELPAVFDPNLVIGLTRSARKTSARVHQGVVYTTDASYRQGPELYQTYSELALGIECECAAVAVAGARLGVSTAALLFCSDNVTAPRSEDHTYRGLANPRVRAGFEKALEAVVVALAEASGC